MALLFLFQKLCMFVNGAGLGSSENYRVPKIIAQLENRLMRNKHNRKKYGMAKS